MGQKGGQLMKLSEQQEINSRWGQNIWKESELLKFNKNVNQTEPDLMYEFNFKTKNQKSLLVKFLMQFKFILSFSVTLFFLKLILFACEKNIYRLQVII